MTVPEFAQAVFAYTQETNASVTSWIRSREHNRSVGGVAGSPHVWGLGADLVYDVPLAIEERNRLAADLGLHIVHEGDHDHLQPVGWENRP